MPAPVDASISVALLAEPDDSRATADTASVSVLGPNEQINGQMKDCVSTVKVLPNTSEGTATDLASHQLVVVPARKSIFMSRLSSCIPKEAIVKYLSNKLSDDDAKKCSIFKFTSARQRGIASFKIIAPAAAFECIMSAMFWPQDIFIKEFVRRRKNIGPMILEQSI